MKKTILNVAAIAATTAVSASYAATVSYSASTAGGPGLITGNGLADGNVSVSLPKWDNTGDVFGVGASLTGVSYTLKWEGYGRLVVSGTVVPTDVVANLTSGTTQLLSNSVGGTTGSVTFTYLLIPDQISLSGIVAPPTIGPVYTSVYSATSLAISDDANAASYAGVGFVSFNLKQLTAFSVNATATGGGDTEITATYGGRSASTVDITYTYNTSDVPEAGTWAAVGFLGLVGGASVLRRKKA